MFKSGYLLTFTKNEKRNGVLPVLNITLINLLTFFAQFYFFLPKIHRQCSTCVDALVV